MNEEINDYRIVKKSDDDGKIKFTERWDRRLFEQIERIARETDQPASQVIMRATAAGLSSLENDPETKQLLDLRFEIDRISIKIDMFLSIFEENSSKLIAILSKFDAFCRINEASSKNKFSRHLYNEIIYSLMKVEQEDPALFDQIKPIWKAIKTNKAFKEPKTQKKLSQDFVADCPTGAD